MPVETRAEMVAWSDTHNIRLLQSPAYMPAGATVPAAQPEREALCFASARLETVLQAAVVNAARRKAKDSQVARECKPGGGISCTHTRHSFIAVSYRSDVPASSRASKADFQDPIRKGQLGRLRGTNSSIFSCEMHGEASSLCVGARTCALLSRFAFPLKSPRVGRRRRSNTTPRNPF